MGGWYHIDQNVKRAPDIETIQGIVSLYDQDKSTGSTVVVPGSHLWSIQLIPENKISAKKKILICCKAGDLVMFNSRTIHCNSPSIISPQEMRKVHSEKLNQSLQNDEEQKENKVI